MKIKKEEQGILILHKEIGKGQTPDGRNVRLIQTNSGIHMQVDTKDKDKNRQGKWDLYTLSYKELCDCFFEEINNIEKTEKKTNEV